MTHRSFTRLLVAVAVTTAGTAIALAPLAPPTTAQASSLSTTVRAPHVQHTEHPATAQPDTRAATRRPAPDVRQVCAAPKRGYAACTSLLRTNVTAHQGLFPHDTTPSGYGPSDLQSAYNLPSATAGSGQTVAIVDAYDDPNAEADLATYRTQYGLSACTTANGCFEKVNQDGQASPLPPPAGSAGPNSAGWDVEESLDVDMASAACPNCHIILVEANSSSGTDLYAAEDEAVTLGAKYVSNSWAGCEYSGETSDDQYFNHPGVVITAAGGDWGYDNYQRGCRTPDYPAASQYVTSVGGTRLTHDSTVSRGWTETTWSPDPNATGSGCSHYEAKPSWQGDSGCAKRMTNDVSAVSDPNTGLAIYDTYSAGGWNVVGGTSAATPIIASAYALAGSPQAGTYPASYPYLNATGLNDVTSGTDYNQPCKPAYFCTAGPGYDGPTGLGTPAGVSAFTPVEGGTLAGTVTDAATGNPIAGATVTAGPLTAGTNSSGQYSLTVAAGSYTVTAKDFGYTTQTDQNVQVTTGQAVTENFALAAKPKATLSGTVTDGSGHGWPLPAQITVTGDPNGPVYVSPYTGAYSITLPADTTYRLRVVAREPGYNTKTLTLRLGVRSKQEKIQLVVNGSACDAVGYRWNGLTQGFDTVGTTPPSGWTVTDNLGQGYQWTFNDPAGRGNLTGGQGGFAIADAYVPPSSSENSLLTSPAFSLSSTSDLALVFDTDYIDNEPGSSSNYADVDLSIDGGQTWASIWQNTSGITGPATVTVPIPQAAGQDHVQVRFHYASDDNGAWEVDNVAVGSCSEIPGGLIAGQVTDANTSAAVNGATVASAADPSESVTTSAALDPALGGGSYELFAAATGSQQVTASRFHYKTAARAASVAADTVTKVNLALKAGQLTVTPDQVTATGTLGSSLTRTFTLANTGTAPVTAELATTSGSGSTTGSNQSGEHAAASVQRIRGKFSPRPPSRSGTAPPRTATPSAKIGPSAGPWTKITSYPVDVARNAVATDPATGLIYSVGGIADANTAGSIYNSAYVYDSAAKHWTQLSSMKYGRDGSAAAFINGKLYVAGGNDVSGPVHALEIYDPAANTWSTGARIPNVTFGASVTVLDGKMYVIGGSSGGYGTTVQVYNPATNSWHQAAPYPEPIAQLSCGAPAAQIYCAGGATGSRTETADAYSYDPASNTWSPIAPLPIPLWGSAYTAGGGQLLISGGVTANDTALTNQGYAYSPWSGNWSAIPNSPRPLYEAGSGCGLYEIGGLDPSISPVADATQLPGQGSCGSVEVPWLSASPSKVTLKPGNSATVTVTLNAGDASVAQPGTYTAGLIIENVTPYQVPDTGVTMTVTPPKTWGEVTGTITAGDGTPLAGATVQIGARDGTGQVYTTTTDAVGHYAWWIPQGDNPLQVIVSDPGYAPQIKKARITAGQTTTVNFNLEKR